MSDGSAGPSPDEAPRGSGRRPASLRARLAAVGLDPDRAEAGLARAGLLDDVELLGFLSDAADPSDALATVTTLAERDAALFAEVRGDRDWLRRIVAVAGASRPLGDLLGRHPDTVRALRTLEPLDIARTAAAVEGAVVDHDDPDEQAAAIASIRRAATADVAARDLTATTPVEVVAAELAGLAEAVLTGALAGVQRRLAGDAPAARIAVIGMGKLGGAELNYVSDVDVIFVHAPTSEDADATEVAEETRKVLEQLLRLLNASTTMGRVYEIDPTLRPEGRAGPLSRTIDSFVAYWERWAETWEFQALIKARPVAGDRQLAGELLLLAEPYVYPDELDPGVVAEIRAMKGRVETKPEVRRHGERQLKLGPGGLRDIEFAVQLLQLVHGRADHTLRVPGTLPALAALAAGGYVADDDARTFADAYRSLRKVEHRLQLAHERRTHTIPDDEVRQEWLARALGYRAEGERGARERFLLDLRRIQAEVRALHEKLFYRPLLEVHAAVPAAAGGVSIAHEVRAMGEDAARERLTALGFRDADAALRDVRALTTGVSRRARTLQAVLPAVLHTLQDSPDPDAGLRMFRTLADAHGRSSAVLGHLRDHPPTVELLARVLGTSEVAGELLVSQPQGFGWLQEAGALDEPRRRDELVKLALGRLHWQDRNAALRRFKRHELLRIVLRDLADRATVAQVGEELTALGEACLEAALAAESSVLEEERGEPLPFRVAVIGMGKLGGRELHYPSDLDVIFVHEQIGADDPDVTPIAIELVGRVMGALGQITAEGSAFEVDADLRPEGRSGPLSRSLSGTLAYYDRWSEPWEHQALLKARPVAGDPDLAGRFIAAVRDRTYPVEDGGEVARMRRMKARIEKERVPRRGVGVRAGSRSDPARHIKLGPGGLSDVEWTVQALQRQHGHAVDLIRTTSTMTAIDALQDASLIDHRDAVWLRDGYRFLSRIRNRLYLMRERNVDVLPIDPMVLERLARSMGYGRGGRQDLEGDHLRHTRRVRSVTERLLFGIAPTASDID